MHVKFTRVNEIEAMHERPRLNVNVERGSTFLFTRGLPYIVSISFTPVKFTYVRTEKWMLKTAHKAIKSDHDKFLIYVTKIQFVIRKMDVVYK